MNYEIQLRGDLTPPMLLIFSDHFVEKIKLHIPCPFYERLTCFDRVMPSISSELFRTLYQYKNFKILRIQYFDPIFIYSDRVTKVVYLLK